MVTSIVLALWLFPVRTSLRETFGDGVDSAKLISFNRTKWSADPLYLGAYSYGAVGGLTSLADTFILSILSFQE